MRLLEVSDLCVSYGDYQVLKHIDLTLDEGEWLMLTGPNGAGKSTIVNAISGGVKYSGSIRIKGEEISSLSSVALARVMGVLAQNHYVGYSFTVKEVVQLGRYAYRRGLFGKEDAGAADSIDKALELTGLKQLRDHSVLELSGGELQRVFLAQLFAQDPQILVLDEPTNHLDLVYQQQIFGLLQEWIKTDNRAVIAVVHDLSMAKAFGSHALLLNKGETVQRGTIDEVLSPENLSAAYDTDVYAWMRKMLGQWK